MSNAMWAIVAMAKRFFDIIVSLFVLILAFPLMVAVWILVSLGLERPALFCQTRPGWHAKPFEMVKFKTMISATDAEGNILEDRDRLTSLGNWLRMTSLDELPELWNVLKGDMSLVGPRPLLMEYLPRYSEFQSRRHEVRPGITGWAQVNGRNAISWEEKFELDVWYIENRSFRLDITILVRTIWQVFKRDGVNSQNHATMPLFLGSEEREAKLNE